MEQLHIGIGIAAAVAVIRKGANEQVVGAAAL